MLLFPIVASSQNDTIFRNNGKIIPCTITLINESAIFYKDKKDFGSDFNLSDVNFYSVAGKRSNVDIKIDTTINGLYINNVNINALDIIYCEIVGFDVGLFSSDLLVYIDYGQTITASNKMRIRDNKGAAVHFNSMIEALNFMEHHGWSYVNQYASRGMAGLFKVEGAMYRYLLRRKN
ncbi:MAG: hypothetical protein V4506_04715 [Bacteroidota bacterium]